MLLYCCCCDLKYGDLAAQAVLGGTVDVLTLDGVVSMKVPAGSQPDSLLVLRNKGIKDLHNQRRR